MKDTFYYHYTDSKGFLGIARKNENKVTLWFSHYKCLNDVQEGSELKRIYDLACSDMVKKGELTREEYACIKDIQFDDSFYRLYAQDDEGENAHLPNSEKGDAYICCFCRNGDSLDMWRYYSNLGSGFSIGISSRLTRQSLNSTTLNNNGSKANILYQLVEYDDAKKIEAIRNDILFWKNDLRVSRYLRCETLKEELENNLPYYRFAFKNECFKHEEEARCIITIPQNTSNNQDKLFKVLYRERNGLIVPYIEVNFPKGILQTVCVSPTAPYETEDTVRMYLKGFVDDVRVERSKLPIRF